MITKRDSSIALELLEGEYSVCRFEPGARIPQQDEASGGVYSITSTHLETSVVCSTAAAPAGAICEHGWRALYVKGPIPFGLTGVVSGITTAVAAAGLPVFVISTFDSDLLLLRSETLDDAIEALEANDYSVSHS